MLSEADAEFEFGIVDESVAGGFLYFYIVVQSKTSVGEDDVSAAAC